jgi:hypothetical protein
MWPALLHNVNRCDMNVGISKPQVEKECNVRYASASRLDGRKDQ